MLLARDMWTCEPDLFWEEWPPELVASLIDALHNVASYNTDNSHTEDLADIKAIASDIQFGQLYAYCAPLKKQVRIAIDWQDIDPDSITVAQIGEATLIYIKTVLQPLNEPERPGHERPAMFRFPVQVCGRS